MDVAEYYLENWRKILATSILFQVTLAIFILMNNFTQKNVERLFMIYFALGLPNWTSFFLIGIPEIILFLLIGYAWYYIEKGN